MSSAAIAPPVAALSDDNLGMRRGWVHEPLDARLGALVIVAGVVLTTIGLRGEPPAHADIDITWWAQLVQLCFWAGACATAAGVLQRRRYALLGALVCALSLGASAVLVVAPGKADVTAGWLAELVCSVAFVVVVCRAIAVSGRRPTLALVPPPVFHRPRG